MYKGTNLSLLAILAAVVMFICYPVGAQAGIPPNNDCANASPIFNGNTLFSTIGATDDGPVLCGLIGADIWYTYVATCTGEVGFDTCGSSFDTVLAVYDGTDCPNIGASLLACNDDAGGVPCPPLQSAVLVNVVAGQQYTVQVGGFSGASGEGVINVIPDPDCNGPIDTGACCLSEPVAFCLESVNPSGKKIPPAGSTTLPGPKGGQNEDGFYELIGEIVDQCLELTESDCAAAGGLFLGEGSQCNGVCPDGTAPVFVTNASGSATFGPFASGSVVKITEAPGATPSSEQIGGPNSAVAAHIKLDSDAFVFAVDSFGQFSPVVSCLVPPPPK